MNGFLSHFLKLWMTVKDNIIFLAEFVGIVAAIFIIAYIAEKLIRKKHDDRERILSTSKVAVVGVMSAISGILMTFEIPLFFTLDFYKLDFSELPVLICGFAFGPAAGVMTEFVKILVKVLIKGTSTAFVGELANFVIGSFFILTASIIYHVKRTKKTAVIACIAGTLMMTVVGTLFNAVYLLPKFAQMFMHKIIAMGKDVNKHVNSVTSLVIMCVAPLNLLKGTVVSAVTMLIYQPLRPVLKKNI